jgi:hypothetical protein
LFSHHEELFTRTKLSTPRAIAAIITCIAITRQDMLVSLEVLITYKPQNEIDTINDILDWNFYYISIGTKNIQTEFCVACVLRPQ